MAWKGLALEGEVKMKPFRLGEQTMALFFEMHRVFDDPDLDGCVSSSSRTHWQGICSRKVELFTWQLLRGGVCVGEVLQKFSIRGLKFNIDGSKLGKPGPAGIRGVLRDSSGKVLCMFSTFIGVHESNSAEILKIHQACALCVWIPSFMGHNIKIVSDSKVAVSRINNGGISSLKHVNDIYDIRCFLELLGGTVVCYASRASNSLTDSLTNMGSSMSGDFVECSDFG
ncbi:hypothetical protein Dsin_013073 [Dipteronia sinensis]|uniref:RNase H type-1 domain-containing protein n=1 Tax=Dipteronia sinensis TaxID=43782 RepID=A0AAE0AJ95_9ROSI|nr:hypothetical protein Dsin_013073 [Dipteronia sinensis]